MSTLKVGDVSQSAVSVADGAERGIRFGRDGAAVIRDAFVAASLAGNVYFTARQANHALGSTLTATAVTLTLSNPIGSGIKMIVHRIGTTVGTAPAGAADYLVVQSYSATVAPTTNTAALIFQNGIETTGSVGRAYSATTLPSTPKALDILGSILATGAVGPTDFWNKRPYVVAPGAQITVIGYTTASNGQCAACWEEIAA